MKRFILFLIGLMLCFNLSWSGDLLMNILEESLSREMELFKSQDTPPYYLGYRVNDTENWFISSSFGKTTNKNNQRQRNLTVSVRVGDYKLDNSEEIRGDSYDWLYNLPSPVPLPLDNNPIALKNIVWTATDDAYKKAVDRYAKVQANIAVKVEREDQSDSFSREEPASYFEPPIKGVMVDMDKWAKKLNRYSEVFLMEKDIYEAGAHLQFSIERKYYLSSEGIRVAHNMTHGNLALTGRIKADDGMLMPLYRSFFAFDLNNLPDDDEIIKTAKEMVAMLIALKNAPVAEPYTGPALMSGSASSVFFHEIFGHRLEGHRQKRAQEGQTFRDMVNTRILPDHMCVVFDPQARQYKGFDLSGYYVFDDEGIKGQRVEVVKNGVLKNFLMSRDPIEGFSNSNGHGRAQPGYQTVTRQSNMFIETTRDHTYDDLRQIMKKDLIDQEKEYGYLFTEVIGGFTMTGRFAPNAFNVTPTVVYRVYADGREDELVRGVDMIGTPLAMFSQISEAGGELDIFAGQCGAESGMVPVSAVSPYIYVKLIETQRKDRDQDRPPILSRPDLKE